MDNQFGLGLAGVLGDMVQMRIEDPEDLPGDLVAETQPVGMPGPGGFPGKAAPISGSSLIQYTPAPSIS